MSTGEQPTAIASSGHGARRVTTSVLLGVTTLLTVVAILAVWANRQLLNADNWSQTSTRLLQSPAVRGATANYLVDQLYANVDVSAKISSALPPRLQGLAGPISGALRNAAVQATELALSRPLVQQAWGAANRAAAQSLVNIVNGGTRGVSVNDGVVTLNLRTILDDVAARLGIDADLGAKLPPAAARLVIMRAKQLKLIQDVGGAVSGLATLLYFLVPILCVAMMALAAGRRRRMLMSIGMMGVVSGLIVILVRELVVSGVTNSLVHEASVRPAANDAVSTATSLLVTIAGAVILTGVVFVVCAWFAGPSSLATPARRWIAPFLREHPGPTYAIVAIVLLLIFIWQPIPATGQPAGMILFTALAALGTEVLRRQTAQEFPEAVPSAGSSAAPGGGVPPPAETADLRAGQPAAP